MSKPTIRPLHVGTLVRDKSMFTYLRNAGKTITLPVLMWYIEGADQKILVDTGAPPPDQIPASVQPYEQPADQHPLAALARIGVAPEEIDVVVLTHLHWDHCQNAELFPRARLLVQRVELSYAAAPLPIHRPMYWQQQPGTRPLMPPKSQVEVVEGDRRLVDGVTLVLVPGHTPGMQGVAVETAGGVYFIASDNIPLYDNWNGYPGDVDRVPNGIHVNLEDYYATFARIAQVADHVLPSHDLRVLDRSRYP